MKSIRTSKSLITICNLLIGITIGLFITLIPKNYAHASWLGEATTSPGNDNGFCYYNPLHEGCRQVQPSWIYYKAVGSYDKDESNLRFGGRAIDVEDDCPGGCGTEARVGGIPSRWHYIDNLCHEEGSGFWHYGPNDQSWWKTDDGKFFTFHGDYYRTNFDYLNSRKERVTGNELDSTLTLLSKKGLYQVEGAGWTGHKYTYSVGWNKSTGKNDEPSIVPASNLNHSLGRGNCSKTNGKWSCDLDVKYIASESASTDRILRYYKKACYTDPEKSEDDCNINSYDEIPSKTWAFCITEELMQITLTVKSVLDGVDGDAGYLGSVAGLADQHINVSNIAFNTSATRGTNEQFIFLGWKWQRDDESFITAENPDINVYVSGNETPRETINIKDLESDVTVYAVYKEMPAFLGEIKATNGENAHDTGMVQENTSSKVVFSCDSAEGCDVTFEHSMERLFNSEGAEYVIKKSDGKTETEIKTGTFSPVQNNIAETLMTHTVRLLPGEKACETLTFNLGMFSSDQFVTIKVCVIMTGGFSASLDLKVNNKTLDNPEIESSWKNGVYAKPGDNIQYRLIYAPSPQFAYNVNNSLLGSRWDNTVTLGGVIANDVFSISNGVTANQTKIVPENAYQVTGNNVGGVLEETAYTRVVKGGDDASSHETPSYAGYEYDINQDNGQWTIKTEQLSSTAYVYVPYNFKSRVSVNNWNQMASAGQAVTVGYNVSVDEKENKVTRGTYATNTGMAKSKVILYKSDAQIFGGNDSAGEDGRIIMSDDSLNAICENSNSKCFAGNENNDGFSSGKHPGFEVKAEVPDWTAGTRICVAVAFYPASSGADTNYNDKEGDHSWVLAKDSSCTTIGKRPTFQVWGGNLYVSKNATTYATAKSDLAGFDNFPGNNRVLVFSSWVEQLAISQNGKITGLASSAATGYNANSAASETFYGGSLEASAGSYCDYSAALGIANANCNTDDGIGNSNIVAGNFNVYELARKVIEAKELNINNVLKTSFGEESLSDYKQFYVYDVNDSVTIRNNIVRSEMAKTIDAGVIIMTKGDINIECEVSRIDAILYAKGNINTCSNAKRNDDKVDYDDSKLARQLVVNGAIYADGTIKFERTYGMATGINSYIPAEIINYDASIPIWTKTKVDTQSGSGFYDVVYRNELAPRY